MRALDARKRAVLGMVAVWYLGACGVPDQSTLADVERQSQFESERPALLDAYRRRLPTPLPEVRLGLEPRGVVDGVGAVDFEVRNEEIGNPPLIIAAGGAEGGFWLGGPNWFPTSRPLGRALVAHGFSIRSIGYFGEQKLPEYMGEEALFRRNIERPLEPIATRIEEARRNAVTNRRCVGFVGVSKGGELTMLLAAYDRDLRDEERPLFDAAVAAVPSHVVWQAPYVTLRMRSGWSLGGEPMDFVPYPWLSPHVVSAFTDYPYVGQLGEAALQNESRVLAAAIPTENIEVPLLMLAGEQDRVWPSAQMSRAALERAERLNPDHPLTLEVYDLNHFVLSNSEPVLETVAFLYETLKAAAERGACEADFLPHHGEVDQG